MELMELRCCKGVGSSNGAEGLGAEGAEEEYCAEGVGAEGAEGL